MFCGKYVELFQAKIKFRVDTSQIKQVICFSSHLDGSNHLIDMSESKKTHKIQLMAAQLLLAKMIHNFAETMEIAGQQQNKTVHFSIHLSIAVLYISTKHNGLKIEFVFFFLMVLRFDQEEMGGSYLKSLKGLP